MPHLLRKNFDENFLSGRIRRGRRNGGETFEEAEEGELDGSVVWAEKPKTGDQEMIWNAKGLDAKTTVKFEKYSIFKDLVYYAFYLLSIPFIVWIGGGVYAPTGRFLVPSKVSLSSLVFAQLALGCCYYAFNGDLNVVEEPNRWLERDSCLDTMTTKTEVKDLRLGSLPLRSYAAHVI